MNELLKRVLSAIAAAFILISAYYFFEIFGLVVICFVSIFIMGREYWRLVLKRSYLFVRLCFYVALGAVFLITLMAGDLMLPLFACVFCVHNALTLLYLGRKYSIDAVFEHQFRSLFGICYIGILTGLGARLLVLPNGKWWFLLLLVIIFSGDIGAYFLGKAFGRIRLMPAVSPNKSVEGAIGGLLASLFAGFLMWQFSILNSYPLSAILFTALFAGFTAQMGDLFESLLKRIAGVKDSGGIMPGHGGLLDRLDGILFSTPLVFVAASLMEKMF